MSGIYIPGMEMPKKIEPGLVIEFADGIDGKRYARLYHYRNGSLTEWLEAVPIPKHGRLIDADVLMARFEKEEKAADEHGRDFSFSFKRAGENCAEWWSVQQMLFDAPTIIPASEEEQI